MSLLILDGNVNRNYQLPPERLYGKRISKNHDFRKKLIGIYLGARIREGDWGKFGMGDNYFNTELPKPDPNDDPNDPNIQRSRVRSVGQSGSV